MVLCFVRFDDAVATKSLGGGSDESRQCDAGGGRYLGQLDGEYHRELRGRQSIRLSKEKHSTVTAANGVLANDVDPNGQKLTAKLGTTTTNGSLTLNADGSFTYTPTSSTFTGTDTFTYTATDGTLTSTVTTVTIAVDTNTTITANAVPFTATSGQTLNVTAANGVCP